MRTLKRWQAVVLGGVVLAAALFGFLERKAIKTATLGPPDRHLRFQFEWPRGERLTYAFAYRGASATSLSAVGVGDAPSKADAEGLEAAVDLDGDLVIESYGARDGGYLLREHVENVHHHTLRVLGQEAIPSDADAKSAFDGKSVLVMVDGAGTVRGMYFAKDEATLFQHVMQSVVTQTSLTIAGDGRDAWDAVEKTPAGTASVHYEVEDLDPPHLVRERTAYTVLAATPGRTVSESDGQLRASTVLDLDADAHRLTSLADDEDVKMKNANVPSVHDLDSHTHFELKLRDLSQFEARDEDLPALAQLDLRNLGDLRVSSRADDQIRDQRIAHLTLDELKNTMLAHASGGDLSSKFLSRATGYLEAHPEACMDMVALFEEPVMSSRARAQVLELLAGAGTPAAQQAMQAALESPVAHADPRAWNDLVQRFSIVQKPTPESVRFVAATYRDAHAESERAATAFTLGASAGHLAKSGSDPALVRASERKLVDDLKAASTPIERKDMLGALGNLALADDAKTIAEFATDDSPEVRASAALALRNIDDEEARGALFGIATDSQPTVANAALQAIGYQSMTDADWRSLAQVVTSGATPPGSDDQLLSLLSRHTDAGEPGVQMLEALAARNTSDNALSASIQHTLQKMR